MPLMSLRAYSRHRGCTLRAVQKAIESGRIGKTPEGKIDSEVADANWEANTDPGRQNPGTKAKLAEHEAPEPSRLELVRAPDSQKKPIGGKAAPEVARVAVSTVVGDESAFVKARTQRETFEAKRSQLKYELEAKELLRATDVKGFFFKAGKIYSASRESIPTHLAPQLAGKTDLGEIELIIRKALREADKRAAESIEKEFRDVAGNAGDDTDL